MTLAGRSFRGRSRWCWIACTALMLAAVAGCAEPDVPSPATPPTPPPPPAIVGEWVQVFPAQAAFDTLVFHPDGTVSGSFTVGGLADFLPDDFAYTKWALGTPVMPGGLCMGDGLQPDGRNAMDCRAYRIFGDTLGLSGDPFPVFVRARPDGRHPDAGSAGSIGSRVPATAPGEL